MNNLRLPSFLRVWRFLCVTARSATNSNEETPQAKVWIGRFISLVGLHDDNRSYKYVYTRKCVYKYPPNQVNIGLNAFLSEEHLKCTQNGDIDPS